MNTEKDFPQEKVAEHSTPKDGGVLLSDNELGKVSGGTGGNSSTNKQYTCPRCGGNDVSRDRQRVVNGPIACSCNRCGKKWYI